MSTASLRQRARDGERLIGVLVRMPCEELVEMAALAGFDFIVVDCEHGPADVIALRQHIAVATLHQVPVIVRVGSGDSGAILRVLDQGAQGVLAPHIDSAQDAAALVAASHYPPLGERGFATYSRAGQFGLADPEAHRDWFLSNTLVLGMVESPASVTDVAAILAVPGLDGIMIGPADLAASSGADDLPLAEATARVNAAIAEAAALRMDIVGTAAAASAAFDDGAQFVVYNLAHALMTQLRTLTQPRG